MAACISTQQSAQCEQRGYTRAAPSGAPARLRCRPQRRSAPRPLPRRRRRRRLPRCRRRAVAAARCPALAHTARRCRRVLARSAASSPPPPSRCLPQRPLQPPRDCRNPSSKRIHVRRRPRRPRTLRVVCAYAAAPAPPLRPMAQHREPSRAGKRHRSRRARAMVKGATASHVNLRALSTPVANPHTPASALHMPHIGAGCAGG